MKLQTSQKRSVGAFTLGETMVALGMASMVGVAVFYTVTSGAILYAKNTAENLAHDSSRIAVNRLLHDIHEAVSVPQLGHIDTRTPGSYTAPAGSWVPYGTNVTFYADNGTTGPTAGVSFQMMGSPGDPNGGPFEIKNDPGNPELIMITSFNHAPQVGMRLIFPYYNMEDYIVNVTSNGQDHWNVWTQNALQSRFKKKKGQGINIVYYTTRWAYAVENGELHLYSTAPPPNNTSWPIVVSRNIVSATPFTQPDSQYVGINLKTEDWHFNKRNYKCVNTLLAGSVPYRAKLCVTQ
jgi:hypothetical protein